MTQYLRYCSITAEGGPGAFDLSTLRCRFEIQARPLQVPSALKLLITNLRADHAQVLIKNEYSKITIDAGYQDGHGIIFKGNIVQGIYGRENPTDTLTTVYAADGDHAHNYATVSTTHPPGSTPNDHLNTALQAMQKFGVTKGFIGVDLSQPVYPRAVTLFGMARDVIADIARSKNASTYYGQEQVHMVGSGQSRPGGAIMLNSSTGLIGIPTQTTEGIFARCLINPQIKQFSQVFIDQRDIQKGFAGFGVGGTTTNPKVQLAPVATDGIYTVLRVDMVGDTRGNPWYMDLGMKASKAGLPKDSELIQFDRIPYVGAA